MEEGVFKMRKLQVSPPGVCKILSLGDTPLYRPLRPLMWQIKKVSTASAWFWNLVLVEAMESWNGKDWRLVLFGTTFDDHPSSLDIPFQSGGFIARMDVVIFGIIVTAYIYLYIYIYIVDRCAKAHVISSKEVIMCRAQWTRAKKSTTPFVWTKPKYDGDTWLSEYLVVFMLPIHS